MKNIFNAAGVKVDNYWPFLFAKLIKEFSLEDLIGFSRTETTIHEINKEIQENNTTNCNSKNEIQTSKESEEDLGFGLFD
jgi:ribosomal protein L12E/L44/L45/RPP1/RPP2